MADELGCAEVVVRQTRCKFAKLEKNMLLIVPIFAAAGYSLLYLLLGGGLGGAILIFIFAKMLGK